MHVDLQHCAREALVVMSDLVNQIEALLVNDMRAVELAAFKIANANRPLQGVGSEVFLDRLNGATAEQFVLASTQASDQAERIGVKRVYQPESPGADENGYVDYTGHRSCARNDTDQYP